MKRINIEQFKLGTAILLVLGGFLTGWYARPSGPAAPGRDTNEGRSADVRQHKVWTCSMHPQIRQPEPGKCPICGMDLIPLDENASMENPSEISMSPTAMQLANVRTALAGFGTPVREVRLSGKVQPDERLIRSQVTHFNGRVEQLAVNFTGETVRAGQVLATLYSPELVTAQEELFAAQKIRNLQPALFEAAKEKLKNWKLSDSQIERLLAAGKAQERFPVLAESGGTVLARKANMGDYLMRGMPLYELADLSKVWVLFDIYENDLPWVRVGSRVEFTAQALPGTTFSGTVAFIDPVINPATRVAQARVEMSNAGGKLKPEMFVSGLIRTQLSTGAGKSSLMAPASAVLWTGERSVVYVKQVSTQGVGFHMQEVQLGPLVGDYYVIRQGLEPGTEIAVSGAYSIDAAAQLAGKPSMMGLETAEAANAPAQIGSPDQPGNIDPSLAKAAVRKLFDQYFPLKDALIKDDFDAAQNHAAALKKAFAQVQASVFSGNPGSEWQRWSNVAATALSAFIAARDIGEARVYFKPLSMQMLALAKAYGPFDRVIYVQHCPMADNNTGADWLSLESQIRNPYFGDQMLTCGSVTQTIKK